MRLAITIGFKHGCATPVVVTGPEVPIGEHRAAFRDLRQLPHHEDFQRVEVWDSSQGRILRKRLGAPGGETPGDDDETDLALASQASGASAASSPAKAGSKKKTAKTK